MAMPGPLSRNKGKRPGLGTMVSYRPGDPATFNRTSSALYRDVEGYLRTAASGVLRDSHYIKNPVTGIFERTTLVTRTMTNLVTQSDNLSSWSGPATVTTGQSDPYGGTSASLVDDTSAGSWLGRSSTVTFTSSSTKGMCFCVKQGTSTTSQVKLRDTTASVDRGTVQMSWSGGVPTLTVFGGATVIRSLELVAGWWMISATVPGIVHTNTNVVEVLAASTAASSTGSVYICGVTVVDIPAVPLPIRTSGSTVLQQPDILYKPFQHPVNTPMTLYVRGYDLGCVAGSDYGGVVVTAKGVSSPPRFEVRQTVLGSPNTFQIAHHNATAEVYSGLQTNAFGELVEFRAQLFSTGSCQLNMTRNSGSETNSSSSAVNAMPAGNWECLIFGSRNIFGAAGNLAVTHAVALLGSTRTRAECRLAAGVPV
jgi:hypothetical protein